MRSSVMYTPSISEGSARTTKPDPAYRKERLPSRNCSTSEFSRTIRGSEAGENYASVALQRTAASGRVTSRRQPIPTGRRSCEEACLLLGRALALGRGLALGSRGLGRGLGRGRTGTESTAVRLRHLLLHLHLHLVLLGLSHHLRGLLLDGHVALILRQLQLRVLLLVRLLDREHLLLVLHLVLHRQLRDRAGLLRLQHAELRLLLVSQHLLLDTILGREHPLGVLQLRLHRAGVHSSSTVAPVAAVRRRRVGSAV